MQRQTDGRSFSLVLTDQRLAGGMTGLDLIQVMRAMLPDSPPAVIITGQMDGLLLKEA